MLRPTFFGIQIGKSGLQTSQYGLDVTGHNIANVETEGFTRQRLVSTAVDPHSTLARVMPVSQMLVGTGVRVKIHDQIRSAYLDRRFRTENTQNAYWEVRSQEFRYLESFFDSVHEETSLNFTVQRFFEAIKILGLDPVEASPRTLVREAGLDLAQQLNLIYDGLLNLQSSHNIAIPAKVDDINRIAIELVELNKAIYTFEVTGLAANDLRDKRNSLIDDLSRIVDVDYRDDVDPRGNPIFIVSIAGEVLVRHDERSVLGMRSEDNVIDSTLEQGHIPQWVSLIDANGNPKPGTPDFDMSRISGGELKAFLDMRDGTGTHVTRDPKGIPYYVEMVNNLARALVQEVNEVHRQGWSNHPVYGSQSGLNFFHDEFGFWENAAGDRLILGSDGWWVDSAGDPVQDPAGEGFEYKSGFWEHDTTGQRLTLNQDGDWTYEDALGVIVVVPDPDAAGYSFISGMSQITARNIRLSDAVDESEFNIACSDVEIRRGTDSNGLPIYLQQGNNENMNKLYEVFSLRRDIVVDGVIINSLDSFATSIRHDVGSTTFLADSAARNSTSLIVAMGNQRTSVAGVSLDEEMVNLIRYQHAYSGAARVITAMDDALDRLINGTGRVGL